MIEFEVERSPTASAAMRAWTPRRGLMAVAAAVVIAVVIGVPTDVIPNPVFGRPVAVTWWSIPTLVITAVLGGLLVATYVSESPTGRSAGNADAVDADVPTKAGGLAGLLSFFAVGCPVCNKLVIVALGATGARHWFEPVQPLLAIASIGLMGWALRARLRSTSSCRLAID